jgi:hypothetical protein
VKSLGEEEGKAGLGERPVHVLRPELDVDAHRLQEVGAAAAARCGAVAGLGHDGARGRGDQRGGRRGVEGGLAVAAGAGGIDGIGAVRDANGARHDRGEEALELGDRLAFAGKRRKPGGSLRRLESAVEQREHGVPRLARAEVLTGDRPRQGLDRPHGAPFTS